MHGDGGNRNVEDARVVSVCLPINKPCRHVAGILQSSPCKSCSTANRISQTGLKCEQSAGWISSLLDGEFCTVRWPYCYGYLWCWHFQPYEFVELTEIRVPIDDKKFNHNYLIFVILRYGSGDSGSLQLAEDYIYNEPTVDHVYYVVNSWIQTSTYWSILYK